MGQYVWIVGTRPIPQLSYQLDEDIAVSFVWVKCLFRGSARDIV